MMRISSSFFANLFYISLNSTKSKKITKIIKINLILDKDNIRIAEGD